MREMTSDIVIIGGGAAGMFAAAVASEYGAKVTLIEKNKYLGRKLGITGKGRCNITNNCSVNEMISSITGNGRFLYSAFNGFTPEDTMAFFERIGVELKTERGGRVFPVTDKAAQVVTALRKKVLDGGVKIVNSEAKSIEYENGAVSSVITSDAKIKCSSVIVCTGGLSYPLTGSTGDGYIFAREAGHSVSELRPSLIPLVEDGDVCSKMQGLSLKNVRLTVFNSKNKEIFTDFGEMLFTHFGVSGPLVLSASAHMRDYEKEKYYLTIDLKPALDEAKLDSRILRDFDKYKNKDFENALSDLLHKKMIPVVVELSGIDPWKKVNSITKEERKALAFLIKHFRINIAGPRPIEEAIITAGGVSVRELKPSTMESKLKKGLYFAGEVLDVEAYTGGYNLQIAWSTAYAAASDAAMNTFS